MPQESRSANTVPILAGVDENRFGNEHPSPQQKGNVMISQVAFDAIHTNRPHIPKNPFAVGGYINGAILSFQWTPDDWAAFPDSYHIRINVTGDPSRGDALDVETGDATPDHVEAWINSRGPNTKKPLLVYCNRSNLAACINARDAAHAKSGHYAFMWCATLDGTITDRAMTQFGQTRVNGTAVTDVSLITDTRLLAAMAANIGS